MVGDVSADAMAASDIVSGESGEDTTEKGDGKLSLRMKLVTPVEEGSSGRFSLQSKSCLHAVPSSHFHAQPWTCASSQDCQESIHGDAACTLHPLSNTFLSFRASTIGRGRFRGQGHHCCQGCNQVTRNSLFMHVN